MLPVAETVYDTEKNCRTIDEDCDVWIYSMSNCTGELKRRRRTRFPSNSNSEVFGPSRNWAYFLPNKNRVRVAAISEE
jgi:hypothetical protein